MASTHDKNPKALEPSSGKAEKPAAPSGKPIRSSGARLTLDRNESDIRKMDREIARAMSDDDSIDLALDKLRVEDSIKARAQASSRTAQTKAEGSEEEGDTSIKVQDEAKKGEEGDEEAGDKAAKGGVEVSTADAAVAGAGDEEAERDTVVRKVTTDKFPTIKVPTERDEAARSEASEAETVVTKVGGEAAESLPEFPLSGPVTLLSEEVADPDEDIPWADDFGIIDPFAPPPPPPPRKISKEVSEAVAMIQRLSGASGSTPSETTSSETTSSETTPSETTPTPPPLSPKSEQGSPVSVTPPAGETEPDSAGAKLPASPPMWTDEEVEVDLKEAEASLAPETKVALLRAVDGAVDASDEGDAEDKVDASEEDDAADEGDVESVVEDGYVEKESDDAVDPVHKDGLATWLSRQAERSRQSDEALAGSLAQHDAEQGAFATSSTEGRWGIGALVLLSILGVGAYTVYQFGGQDGDTGTRIASMGAKFWDSISGRSSSGNAPAGEPPKVAPGLKSNTPANSSSPAPVQPNSGAALDASRLAPAPSQPEAPKEIAQAGLVGKRSAVAPKAEPSRPAADTPAAVDAAAKSPADERGAEKAAAKPSPRSASEGRRARSSAAKGGSDPGQGRRARRKPKSRSPKAAQSGNATPAKALNPAASELAVQQISVGTALPGLSCKRLSGAFSATEHERVNLCFRLNVGGEGNVRVLWRREGELRRQSELSVPAAAGAPLRAFMPIRSGDAGAWTVQVLASSGRVLGVNSFRVEP